MNDCFHSPELSSIDRPDTPTNQSGLGAIIETSVTRGCSVVSTTPENVAVAVGTKKSVVP